MPRAPSETAYERATVENECTPWSAIADAASTCKEAAGDREVLRVPVGGARDEGAIDRELPERGAQLLRVVDFARGDLEANGLAALREHAVGCVEDLTARRGDGFQRLLLLDREREPLLAVDELHLPRLHEDGDGEDREHGVRDADASRAISPAASALVDRRERKMTCWSAVGMCMFSFCSAIGCSRARLDASRIDASRRTRSASSAARFS